MKTDEEEQKRDIGEEGHVSGSSSSGECSIAVEGSGEPDEAHRNASSSPCAESQLECRNAGNVSKQSPGKERRKNRKGAVLLQEFGSDLIFDLDM
jgi:hypothetical protein